MTEKFSETERFEEFVDNLNRKGFQIPEAELAVQSIYDEGFEAGRIAEHKDVLERALNFSLPEIKEKLEQIQEQARKETLEEVRFQAEKLNTLELKEKAPICWTKLQQFIGVLETMKKEKSE